MIESPALDFWRKSEKPEVESYTIDHDFRKIQVKNTASYWILPYIICITMGYPNIMGPKLHGE